MTLHKTRFPGYMKDTSTGAVLNTTISEMDQIRMNRKRKAEHEDLKQRVENIETGLSDIKNDLSKILEALKK